MNREYYAHGLSQSIFIRFKYYQLVRCTFHPIDNLSKKYVISVDLWNKNNQTKATEDNICREIIGEICHNI